jgi:hypothetical protein
VRVDRPTTIDFVCCRCGDCVGVEGGKISTGQMLYLRKIGSGLLDYRHKERLLESRFLFQRMGFHQRGMIPLLLDASHDRLRKCEGVYFVPLFLIEKAKITIIGIVDLIAGISCDRTAPP